MDPQNSEEFDGIKFVWNILPSNRTDMTKIVIPPSFHYTPAIKNENMQLLEYNPLFCPKCKSVISPLFSYNVRAKLWECPFCNTRVSFPKEYADFITETNLPAELYPENTTVEYKLNKKESNHPTFIFLIDVSVEEDELNELKDSVQQVINELPQECQVGVITFGKMCNIHEIGNTEMPVSYALNGEKSYKGIEIQEFLGLLTVNQSNPNEGTFNTNHPKFIMPVGEVAFTLNSFLDDLQPDSWTRKQGERASNCVGLAIQTAVSILEAITKGEPSRILTFMGNPGTIGNGAIVGKELKETIRNYVDFELGNSNTKYYKIAKEFYDQVAMKASRLNIVIDVFSCCLNQVGLYETKNLVAKTGGYMIFTDSFSTMIFKDSLKKIFELDDNGNLKLCFKAKLEINTTSNIKISGALGHLSSCNVQSPSVSDVKIGESNTKTWLLGGIDGNSTYTFVLDCNVNNSNDVNYKFKKSGFIQIITTYIAGDRTTRMRVTTVEKKILYDLNSPHSMNEIGNSFDQEAAAVLITRMCIHKSDNGEDSREILKWIDKTLIRLMSKFGQFVKDDPRSFKLTQTFVYFPQFIFYLRRSSFVQAFNESPDENMYYKSMFMSENVQNCTVMIQPLLFEYTPDNPKGNPVFLDLNSMKNDCVLLLDTFFYVVVWHGIDVVGWREAGYQDQEEFQNIKTMLDLPLEYAQKIVMERLPTPRFVTTNSGKGQERLVKCIVNPSQESKNNVKESGFFSDDVNLKVFMDYLKKLAVSS